MRRGKQALRDFFILLLGVFLSIVVSLKVLFPKSYSECMDYAYQYDLITKMNPFTRQCYAEIDGQWISIRRLKLIKEQ